MELKILKVFDFIDSKIKNLKIFVGYQSDWLKIYSVK